MSDERTRLRGLYHAVLREIAQQVPLAEVRSAAVAEAAFKEWFRSRLHPGQSTEALLEEPARFKAMVQEMEAIACTELGCTFTERAAA